MPTSEIGFSNEEIQKNFLFPGEIPKEEQAVLTKFGALVRTALLRLRQNDEIVSRETLLRFLRGEDFDVCKAADQIYKMVDWRLLHGIDEIRDSVVAAACVGRGEEADEQMGIIDAGNGGLGHHTGNGIGVLGKVPAEAVSAASSASSNDASTPIRTQTPPVLLPIWQKIPCHEISEYYPIRYHTHLYACDGTPLYFELTGQIDMQRLLELYTPDDFIQYTREAWEFRMISVHNISKLQKRMVKYTEIRDLEGLGWKHLWKRGIDLVRVMVREGSQNYSETLQRVIIINAPWVFKLGWAILEPMLHPRTLRKIQILGTDYQEALQQYIPAESLPRRYGGVREDRDCLPVLVLGCSPEGVIRQATAAAKAAVAAMASEVSAEKLVPVPVVGSGQRSGEDEALARSHTVRRRSFVQHAFFTEQPPGRGENDDADGEVEDDFGADAMGGVGGRALSTAQLLQIAVLPIAMVGLISAQLSYSLVSSSAWEGRGHLLGVVDLVFIVAVTSATTAMVIALSEAGASLCWRGICCLSAAYLAARSFDDDMRCLS